MRKLTINKKILTIKGEPIKREEPLPGVTDTVMRAVKTYNIASAEALKEQFEKWQEQLKETKQKTMEARDYFLTILGSKFKTENNKEAFWTSELGIMIADEKNKEIEISDDKYSFLKRIMSNNKIKQMSPAGEKEIDVFFPHELGQILALFEEDEEAPKAEKQKK